MPYESDLWRYTTDFGASHNRRPDQLVWCRSGPGRACRSQGNPGPGDPEPPPALRLGDAGSRASYRIRAVSGGSLCRRSSSRSGPRCSFDQDEQGSPLEAPSLDLPISFPSIRAIVIRPYPTQPEPARAGSRDAYASPTSVASKRTSNTGCAFVMLRHTTLRRPR